VAEVEGKTLADHKGTSDGRCLTSSRRRTSQTCWQTDNSLQKRTARAEGRLDRRQAKRAVEEKNEIGVDLI